MSRFSVPDESPPPLTPERGSRGGSGMFKFDNNPSTTPAGPPPSSSASFTPAGAPSASYLGSSIMRGVTAQKPVNPINYGNRGSSGSSKSLLSRGSRSPLGRSIRSSKVSRQPSRLSRQLAIDDESDSEDEEDDDEDEENIAPSAPRSFGLQYSDDDGEEDEEEAGEEDQEDDHTSFKLPQNNRRQYDEEEDGEYEEDDVARSDGARDDLWLDMDQAALGGHAMAEENTDLLELMNPTIDNRVRQEAESIFRASMMQSAGRGARELNFAPVAKNLYEQMGYASISEPPQLILETDTLVSRLYHEGVGTEDNAEKLDAALARTSGELVKLWTEYVSTLPQSDEEHVAGIGPGPRASPFEKAAYLASLALQVHHTRVLDSDDSQLMPLPEVLFQWLGENHNLYPTQTRDIKNYRPSPACHTLFWQTVFINILQGRVSDALGLLRSGGFDQVKKGHALAYTGRALSNVQRAVHETCEILEACPGINGDWDLWDSDWTLFRVRAKGALDQLRRFAEGKDKSTSALSLSRSDFPDSGGGGGGGRGPSASPSLAGLARKAESQVPWDIYENINIIFDIVLGSQERILQVSQDWCEATIAMFGWWDEGRSSAAAAAAAKVSNLRMSQSLSRSQLLPAPPRIANPEDYLDRLARSFQAAVSSGLEINSNSPLEVGMACVLEDNPKGLVGILRAWSLPVAAAVAEIASLGGWLPMQPGVGVGASPATAMYTGFDLDMDDLQVLGLDPRGPDELDGIKDNTLVQYAQALVNLEGLASVVPLQGGRAAPMEGWELAIHVLGRMDSPERSEDTVGELVKTLLQDVDAEAGATVENVWRLLNDLGMIEFAEETAEHFGDVLARDSHNYGQAMWYYSLSHRPSKVREVMNLLIAHSLLQSTAFPPDADLDDHLRRLVHDRNETLARLAAQDLEAAELLGRMLSGYATLRRFYDLRDGASDADTAGLPLSRRKAAAAECLMAVISSSDDNVRGGLYDPSRDTVVSEDFLLALLGEATALVDSNNNNDGGGGNARRSASIIGAGPKAAITLDHIEVLLKAAEDLTSLRSTSVYATCDEFFKLAMASAQGLKGSTPADLMRRSTSGLSVGSTGGSYVMMSGSSMLASQLHRSVSSGSMRGGKAAAGAGAGAGAGAASAGGATATRRAWDWRKGFTASTTADDVLRRLRLGVARDLARLWVEEADGVV